MTRREQIKQYERLNRKYEARYLPAVKSAIHSKVKIVIGLLKSKGFSAAEYYCHTNVGNARMGEVIKKIYTEVGRRWAQLEYSRLLPETQGAKRKADTLVIEQKGFGFNYQWTKFILQYLEKYLFEKVTFEIERTTQNAMLRVLSRAQAAGWSIDQTVDRLEDWPFERYQAARIVRTEVNRAANVGSTAQAETSEYEQMKEWQSAEDLRVRGNPTTGMKDHADHWSLDGVKINAGDVFHDPRNGDQLEFPGDPRAKAESVINCRCHASYTFKRDQNDQLIPKRKTTVVIFPGQVRQRQTITI
jgi:hypothetical protein